MNIIFDNGEKKFSLNDYENYEEFLNDILSTVAKEDDIISEYTIEIDEKEEIDYSIFDIDFNCLDNVKEIWNWYAKVREYDDYDLEVILAYASLYCPSIANIENALDYYIGCFKNNNEAARFILEEYHEFNRVQSDYILNDLGCEDKIVEDTESWNDYYFWK